jgi:alkylresorcinol/alkylpyrone synthase
VVLAGPAHPRAKSGGLARLADAESAFFRNTTHLMGFHLRNQGLQIVLDRGLAPFVRREVLPVVQGFLRRRGLERDDIARWILHPGGRRIIEVMAEQLGLHNGDLAPTEAVLAEHGNMSSVTVLFVLDEILRRHRPRPGERGVLGAFGPGFGAELALLEFC